MKLKNLALILLVPLITGCNSNNPPSRGWPDEPVTTKEIFEGKIKDKDVRLVKHHWLFNNFNNYSWNSYEMWIGLDRTSTNYHIQDRDGDREIKSFKFDQVILNKDKYDKSYQYGRSKQPTNEEKIMFKHADSLYKATLEEIDSALVDWSLK